MGLKRSIFNIWATHNDIGGHLTRYSNTSVGWL